MKSLVRWAIVLLVVLLCVHEHTAKGGRGGSRGGGSRSSSRGGSWFSSSSRGSSSHSSTSHSTPSKGNWFTNLFRSSKPSSSSSSSSSSSASKPASPPNYPRQPSSSSHDAPPSYGSLYPHGSSNAKPPSYGWATGAGATGAGGAHTSYHAPQATNFGAFTPQNHVSSTSYHFIPVMVPHSHSHTYHHYHNSYYGSRASPSSSASSSAAVANETLTTPKPLTAPIVYDMDTSALQPANERKKSSPALVLVVNNMVVYGDMQTGQNLVMVIDEHYEDVGEIPAGFLDFVDEDEVTDYNPPKRTTSTTSTTTENVFAADGLLDIAAGNF